MPTPLRRGLRLAGKSAWYSFAVLALLLALGIVALNQGMRWLEHNPQRVAAWMSARAKMPIAFTRLQAGWTHRGPLLTLDGVRVGAGRDAIPVGRAEVMFAPYTGWMPNRSFTEFRLRGLALTLERQRDGTWRVRGLPGQQGDGDPLEKLDGLGELQVIGGSLHVLAPDYKLDVQLPRVDLRLKVTGRLLRSGLRAWQADGVAPIEAALRYDRKRAQGRVHVGARRVDIRGWSQLLRWHGVMAVAGAGNAEAWADLDDGRVVRVNSRGDMRDVVLQSEQAGAPRQQRYARLEWNGRFEHLRDDWLLQLPTLRFENEGASHVLDGVVWQAREGRWAARAKHLPLQPLLALAALSDTVSPGLRRWFAQSVPQGVLHEVSASGTRNEVSRIEARAEKLGFRAVGDAPGLSSLSGRIVGDGEGASLTFDPATEMVFDWPRGFGVAHPLKLTGSAQFWREGAGWRVGTHELDLQGRDYHAHARGGLWFQNDGTLPWIDVVAEVEPTRLPVAKKFWLHYLMPREVVHWLDTALVDGQIVRGRAIASGDLDDWAFSGRNGRFEALVDIRDATVKFQPDWPALTDANLHVAFIGPGMHVEGSGKMMGVQADRVVADIADFGHAQLEIDSNGHGDIGDMLALLQASPLAKDHGPALARVEARGPARNTFRMSLPLGHTGKPLTVAGDVALEGVALRDRELDLAFDQVRGQTRFDHNGFSANKLAVQHVQQPGALSLRAGEGHVRDARHVFEADLEAALSAESLLARAPEVNWLKPYLHGTSRWNVAVALPRGMAAASPSAVELQSDLLGTAITLPAPLGKAANEALPSKVRIPLPVGSDEIAVSLGNRLGVRAATRGGRTGIRATLGSAQASAAAPASGVVVDGRAAQVDALDWIGFMAGGETGSGMLGGGDLRVDVQAGQLGLLGSRFPNTRLKLDDGAQQMQIRVDGPAIAGNLQVPKTKGATLTGRFGKAYLNGGVADFAGRGGAAKPAATEEVHPAHIPPLDIAVEDLRVGKAQLGQAQMRSHPAGNGMQIDALTLRAPRHAVDISGAWTGSGNAAHTRLQARLNSQDYGRLMERLGMPGQVKRGHGSVELALAWPGSPMQLNPADVDGEARIDVRDGQLVQLEPGPGRVLGLFSVTQLPRRLGLDFRDFFDKGFAFNRAHGRIAFADGRATSDGLEIDGPAANIGIGGSADLRTQRFDQVIEVKPRTGNLLTVAGALAGGPVGAAVGAMANAILKKPLSEVGAKTYRVTGPWEDPKVEVVPQPRAQPR